ncbi:hypothetical protein IGI04_004001 [Brassica rapa subsp. trilocularis]|uniref:Uncharacterized protein n=1 Tax=Brassica rapa subsp. trilocularis TaxID=1813537 RepID=A0ABQ7P018_BRACM|nr:hypothetical protein IGI04_004001 [Brassica rapa subsp. trilocularis]
MQDLQSPNIRSYKSYEGGRNLQLVDPADLKPVRGIYVVRESKRNRSPMTSDPWRKISYKDMPVKSRRPPSHSKTLKEIQKSEATCKKFLGEAPVHPCKEKACKEVCKEHYYHSCKGECEMHGYEEHCHCYGKY